MLLITLFHAHHRILGLLLVLVVFLLRTASQFKSSGLTVSRAKKVAQGKDTDDSTGNEAEDEEEEEEEEEEEQTNADKRD